ncbi:exodeoxyribonuclease VII large subunit [Alteribacter natronophilus]|uniref:exodeoxyribonuclease VII large subunit n=1 Tax=Alteribacter natronophilus TaxID=2583810 RepID=UPI00110F39B2|nr:exodeoxyribonuclease VII large subunit [Alteribacter natronophilus]TMW73744.1 exodeoxyribonuclease VII large subunit [Alteribacter natronophilus]
MQQNYLTVSSLTRQIKRLIDDEPVLQNVWIRAEISNFKKHSRGHMYFTLKDENSRIQSVMFAGSNRFLKFLPENGMNVLVRGDVSVYEPHGQYQFYVKEMQPDGIGNLYLAYEELKKKLEIKGYFSEERKKPIPAVPSSIAVITSRTGAAVRDILTTLKRRYPAVKITLLPVLVQGPGAAPSVARAIRQAGEAGMFDVIIAGRGGGSIEELWAFNEEIVADAIFDSPVPVISAVGHETDVTISDFTADLRAPTPTAAAELAVPDVKELEERIRGLKMRAVRAAGEQTARLRERLSRLDQSYAFRYPGKLISQKEQELDRLMDSLQKGTTRLVQSKRESLKFAQRSLRQAHPRHRIHREADSLKRMHERFKAAASDFQKSKEETLQRQLFKLDVLSPLKMMERGYSLAYDSSGSLLKSTEQAQEDDPVTIRLEDGLLYGKITGKKEDKIQFSKRGEENE